jgi:filamentous hemagglutinin family protein
MKTRSGSQFNFRHRLLYVAVASCFSTTIALANPVNPTVVSGGATFATAGSTLTVTNTPNTIVNWQQFGINNGETVRFIQQSSASSILNRVTGGDMSRILGTLQSNGKVFLVNPNGIVMGQGSVIDVAGLVASSLNMTDADSWPAGYASTPTASTLAASPMPAKFALLTAASSTWSLPKSKTAVSSTLQAVKLCWPQVTPSNWSTPPILRCASWSRPPATTSTFRN